MTRRQWRNPVHIDPLTGQLDAFGRIKTATPTTLFDSKQLHDKVALFWSEEIINTSGNATSVHSTVDASTVMHVEAGDTIIRQTKTHWNYQPGNAQELTATANMSFLPATAGVTARVGLFTATDGIFFQLSNGVISCVVRKASVDNAVQQADWEIDKLDGTGVSRIAIDPTMGQILYIDYEWLAIGTVRFGFFLDGRLHWCHWMHHSNLVASTYMSTPNLPVRYEISSTDATAELQHICSTVISSGGQKDVGLVHGISNSPTGIIATTVDVIYAGLAIRLKSTYLDAQVKPLGISFLLETADNIEWAWLVNPTIAGTFTFVDVPNSAVQLALGQGAGGNNNVVTVDSWDIKVDTGYGVASGSGNNASGTGSSAGNSVLSLGSEIDGTPDVFVLAVRGFSAAALVQLAMTYEEFL